MIESEKEIKYIPEINILKIMSSFCIFFYYCYSNMGCSYSILNYIINQSGFFMTLFFILSGFMIYRNHSDLDIQNWDDVAAFYKDKVIRIFPMYLIVWVVFYFIEWSNSSLTEDLFTFPFQLILFQSTAGYSYLMNSGIWFLSCLVLSYILYPLIKVLISNMEVTDFFVCAITLILLVTIFPVLGTFYGIDSYHNTFARIFEFILGVMLCRLFEVYQDQTKTGIPHTGLFCALITILSFGTIFVLNKSFDLISRGQDYFRISGVILGSAMIFLYAANEDNILKRVSNSLFMRRLSNISFEIMVASYVTTEIYNRYLRAPMENEGHVNCLVTLIINIVIAVIMRTALRIFRKPNKTVTLHAMYTLTIIIFLTLFTVKSMTHTNSTFFKDRSYKAGTEISFCENENTSSKYIVSGFSDPEATHTWTDGNQCILHFDKLPAGTYQVTVNVLNVYTEAQTVTFTANANKYTYDINKASIPQTIQFEASVAADKKLELTIDIPNATSPESVGESEDARKLGIAVSSIVISQ